MGKKIRLDVLLTEKGLQESRQKAQATIMSGLVYADGGRGEQPGVAVSDEGVTEVRGNAAEPGERGGY